MAIIKLEASDGQIIPMEEHLAAEMSSTLKGLVEDRVHGYKPISIKSVDPVTLREVVEYCEKHTMQPADDFKAWEEEFKKQIDGFPKLFRLINASDYLGINALTELTIQKAVEMIKDMTVEEVREVFNLTNDFTEEEEAKLRRRFGWAFQ